MDNCFSYFANSHKLCYTDAYPYQGKYKVCQEAKCERKHFMYDPVMSIEHIPKKDVYALMDALDKQPVALAVQADSAMFTGYKSGVLLDTKDMKCGTKLNHAVLAVGYYYTGDILSEYNYIMVKNSWGESWGDEGYIRIGFGNLDKGGTCGFLLDASYPVTS